MSFEKTVNKLAGLDAFMRREAKLITGEVIGAYFVEYVSRMVILMQRDKVVVVVDMELLVKMENGI